MPGRPPTACGRGLTRRQLLCASLGPLVGAYVVAEGVAAPVRPRGPAARLVPRLRACFVRRQGEYGIRWPGEVYDGEAALFGYTDRITQAARRLGFALDVRPTPLYSSADADAWITASREAGPDGLLVVLLDRQEHAWPTADKAIATGIPTVIFSPIGTSFTTNTAAPSARPGCFICSTDDFTQVEWGMKMLHAVARMRAARCLVIQGNQRSEGSLGDLGISLRTIPAADFVEEYQRTPADAEIRRMASELVRAATRCDEPSEGDILNGLRSYAVAQSLLAREHCDAITMDCLGALGPTDISLPCIAWAEMNDHGIPAACEADLGAVASHLIVQYLLDRPGFQQDPVAETVHDAIIGAHCSCPTRLAGFGAEPEPYDIVHHHGMRDATLRTVWKPGQRITCMDVLPGNSDQPSQMLISSGEVLGNVAVPPAGGCRISVMAHFDGVQDVLAFPGFHQLFVYGDFKKELVQFCKLCGIKPVVV